MNCNKIVVDVQEKGNGWLYRSAMAKIWHLRLVQSLQNAFLSKGVMNIQIRSCGSKMVTLTFESKEEMEGMLEEGKAWLNQWFEECKP